MLSGKTILVTGGARGIGRACVELLARQGANVICHYNSSEDAARELSGALAKEGHAIKTVKADISAAAGVKSLFQFVKDNGGRLDALVNNAGVMKKNMMAFTTEAEMSEQWSLNVSGTYACMQAAARIMSRQGEGRIVNIGSIVGVEGAAGHTYYAATKGAVESMTLAAAKELGQMGIKVNCVAPGVVETDLIKGIDAGERTKIVSKIALGRLGIPSDVAGAVAFFCSPWSDYVTGQVLVVDGCYSI